MRTTLFVLVSLAACGGSSASIDDPSAGDKSSSGSGSGSGASSSGGSGGSSSAGSGCPSTKSGTAQIGDSPAPLPRSRVVFDIVNNGSQTVYVVNDDGEHEMLDIASGAAKLRLSAPPTISCGKSLAPLHPSRFLYAVAPGETRTVGGWDKTIIADGDKVCVACKDQGRPDLGVQLVDQYTSIDAANGQYTATVKVLTALPAGCTPAAQGFSCASWPGASALASSIRSSDVAVSIGAEPLDRADQHVTVPF